MCWKGKKKGESGEVWGLEVQLQVSTWPRGQGGRKNGVQVGQGEWGCEGKGQGTSNTEHPQAGLGHPLFSLLVMSLAGVSQGWLAPAQLRPGHSLEATSARDHACMGRPP